MDDLVDRRGRSAGGGDGSDGHRHAEHETQTDWAKKVYGKQSEQIRDYEQNDLVDRLDDPAMKKLREWVDPYSYRARYKMPKLLLLGTNDPYWTVDSLRHYWNDLPEPKLIFQTPNAGHDLGRRACKPPRRWPRFFK